MPSDGSQPIIPNQFELMWPVLKALHTLGGSAHIDEITQQVVKDEGFTEEQQALRRGPGDHMSRIEYYLAWARNGLKNAGAIENSARGVWSLTDHGRAYHSADAVIADVKAWRAEYNRQYLEKKRAEQAETAEDELEDEVEPDWKEQLIDRLLQMSPAAFERLTQRLLREAGFRNVEVLGRSGDGGIDGVGVLRIALVSFPVYFQCKRYRGSVSAGAVRDFRGAMAGRGEKGLLVTTGTFTKEAREEASRDGAPPVELISGDELTDLLKTYDLGVTTTKRVVEDNTVNPTFFDSFESA